ncbi:response regulator transcription factor [Paenibacillus oceani]|uniref:Response regulator n=1 Tax=Paenibacillus oceani TaxID=2772510 RepID=A0A927C787_9BACL|nr:response regulator [Paenibacillus oceani]MBD2861282.1 response regulator [Paenibacillus oceani]
MYTVIVADDEYMVKRSLSKLIETSGEPFRVAGEAEDGREALELADRLSPDLIITDIRMPVMDGLELIEALKHRKGTAEIVVLSGYDDFGYAQRALRAGVFDYLLKPVKPQLLVALLQRLSDKLGKNRHAATKRSEWLQYSRNKAGPLAERIWLLNREEVQAGLSGLHADLMEDEPEPAELKERYSDLLTLVTAELENRSGGTIASAAVEPMTWPDAAERIAEAVVAYADEVMEELRATRKWGAQHYLHRVVEHIREHYAKPTLDLQEVADLCEMSPSYFSRVFKQEIGVSFIHYLTGLRLDQAKALLEDPRYKTYEIAQTVGYEDYPHFAKMFKKQIGLSPSEYRKRLGIK